MAAKRLLATFALAALLGSTGCRSWCERHYPCPAPMGAPTSCAPCAPPATCYSAPTPAWNAPAAVPVGVPVAGRPTCTCTCQ